MDLFSLDLLKVLDSPPSPPGALIAKYYSIKRSFSSLCMYMGLLRLEKTVDTPSLPPYTPKRRKRVVVAGGGWACVSFVKNLDFNQYEVVWIAPSPLFSFTPLLASCIGGVLPPFACTQHLRYLLSVGGDPTARGVYRQASIKGVNFKDKTVSCVSAQPGGGRWDEPYDYLVIGIGSEVRTFGCPGVEEHACFLKTADDAQKIRERVLGALERAASPAETEETRQQLLTFVIVGGGPTGVETAAELQDFLAAEGSRVYPHLKKYFSVVLVESGDCLLRTYLPKIQDGARRVFRQNNIKMVFNTRVVEVQKDRVIIRAKTADAAAAAGEAGVVVADAAGGADRSIRCGFVLWTAGVQPAKVARDISFSLPQQHQADRLLVDPAFRVLGTEGVFAIGDCCTVAPPPLAHYSKQLYQMAGERDKEGLAGKYLGLFSA